MADAVLVEARAVHDVVALSATTATDLPFEMRPIEDLSRQPETRSASGDVEGVLKSTSELTAG